jgi:hypothetical protein
MRASSGAKATVIGRRQFRTTFELGQKRVIRRNKPAGESPTIVQTPEPAV